MAWIRGGWLAVLAVWLGVGGGWAGGERALGAEDPALGTKTRTGPGTGTASGLATVAGAATATATAWVGNELFAEPRLVRMSLEFSKASANALRRNPREYAEATLVADGQRVERVSVKLKGAAGSYRDFDDRPALTVSFNRLVKGRRWMGLRRIHLNNSVQDETLLNEYLAGELFRATGVPATRVAWARLTLDGRDLGTYVLKEAFEEEFLSGFFTNTTGNLYDGGFCREITEPLERDLGEGPENRADLAALAAAARVRDPAERWRRMQAVLDVDRFLSYAAVSAMLADWDGYAMNRNNYRVYVDPGSRRAVLMPHGTDQLLQRYTGGLDASWNGMLAEGLLSTPTGRQQYRQRFLQIFTNQFRLDWITNRLVRVSERLAPQDPEWGRRVRWMTTMVRNRRRSLEEDPDVRALVPGLPKPKAVPPEGVMPDEWLVEDRGESRMEESQVEGRSVLRIEATGPCTSSFRGTVLLPRGRYRFEGRVRTEGVRGLKDLRGEGAGLRISGSPQTRENALSGTHAWTVLRYDFELAGDGTTVVLVAELRGTRGRVEFDRNSLRVVPRRD